MYSYSIDVIRPGDEGFEERLKCEFMQRMDECTPEVRLMLDEKFFFINNCCAVKNAISVMTVELSLAINTEIYGILGFLMKSIILSDNIISRMF